MEPPLSLFCIANESPFAKANFSFANGPQLETVSWLGMGDHVHFPSLSFPAWVGLLPGIDP